MFAAVVVALTLVHPQPTWVDCNHAHDVRPAGITVACGDGNFWINRLDFKTWGPRTASGVGAGHLNDCNPDCATGHFHAESISIRFSRVVTCGGKRPLFSRITWTWSLPKPAWRGSENWNGSLTAPCSWLRPRR